LVARVGGITTKNTFVVRDLPNAAGITSRALFTLAYSKHIETLWSSVKRGVFIKNASRFFLGTSEFDSSGSLHEYLEQIFQSKSLHNLIFIHSQRP
jgi:hypothetical protein